MFASLWYFRCPERFMPFERAKMLHKHLLHSIRRGADTFFFSVALDTLIVVGSLSSKLVRFTWSLRSIRCAIGFVQPFSPFFIHVSLSPLTLPLDIYPPLMSTAYAQQQPRGFADLSESDWRPIQLMAAFNTHLWICFWLAHQPQPQRNGTEVDRKARPHFFSFFSLVLHLCFLCTWIYFCMFAWTISWWTVAVA